MRTIKRVTLLIATLTLAVGLQVSAQDSAPTGWQQSLIIDMTATQTAYSDSWEGGEAGSFNWVGNVNGQAEKQYSPKLNFRSTLKISFGQTFTQDAETKNWSKPKKSTDLIDWENLVRFTVGKPIDPYAAIRLETQFQDASVPDKKRSFSPLHLTESFGIAHEFYKKDKDQILSRFGLALKQTYVKAIVDSSTFETKTISSNEWGFESVTDASLTLSANLKYTSKLSLFKAFSYSKKDEVKGTPAEDYWKAIDINWENIINATVSKIVSVNMYTQLLYDKEVSLKGRLKETLGIGFVFKLI